MDILLPDRTHPTLTLLIDDSRSFLDSLSFQMPDHLAHRTFDDTQRALDWLQNNDAGLGGISNLANRNRFLTPSVLVVDYKMPRMDGLAFCRAIQGRPCKKILLTGLSGEKIGKEALSQGLIDGFVQKHAPDALERLETEIIRLQRKFFIDQTQARHPFLSDPVFASLATEIFQAGKFVEYETFDDPPGILFLDAMGRATLMVVETKSALIAHAERIGDEPAGLADALRDCRVVSLRQSRHRPAQHCRGAHDYYWALFELPSDFLTEPVYSCADFLKEQR